MDIRVCEPSDDDDGDVSIEEPNLADHRNAIQHRHPYIGDNGVYLFLVLLEGCQGFLAVPGTDDTASEALQNFSDHR